MFPIKDDHIIEAYYYGYKMLLIMNDYVIVLLWWEFTKNFISTTLTLERVMSTFLLCAVIVCSIFCQHF